MSAPVYLGDEVSAERLHHEVTALWSRRPDAAWARAEYRRRNPAPGHPSPYVLSPDLFFLDLARAPGRTDALLVATIGAEIGTRAALTTRARMTANSRTVVLG